MTRDAWLTRHPYLKPAADLAAVVDAAAARLAAPIAEPDWPQYLDDFHAGVPLLESDRAAVAIADRSRAVLSMLDGLLATPLPAALSDRCRALRADVTSPGERGLYRYLLWSVLARDLRPVVAGFSRWRDEERWLRNYCPTCGEAPAMAQLAGKDPGRLRLMSCGCCGTRWRYRRTGCPFCERTDDHRLSVVGVEGEGGLRIDFCESCHGYLKTYDGEGSEDLFLADWTSMHLDVVARDRGLKRLAASLYEI